MESVMDEVMSLDGLENIASATVILNGSFTNAAIYNSNCECPDSDGCDGDCGGDCSDSGG